MSHRLALQQRLDAWRDIGALPGAVRPLTSELVGGEELPTTRWINPMWDRWLELAAQASGGQNPVFGARGSSLRKLPTSQSLDALKHLVNQGWGDWQSLEAPRKTLENY